MHPKAISFLVKDREWPHILAQLYASALSVLSVDSLYLCRNSTLFTEEEKKRVASINSNS